MIGMHQEKKKRKIAQEIAETIKRWSRMVQRIMETAGINKEPLLT